MRLPLAVLLSALLLLAFSISPSVSDTPGDLTTAEGDAAAESTAAAPPAEAAPAEAAPAEATPPVADEAGAPPEADPLLALPAEGPPPAPTDPSALADLVTAAEQAIRDPARAPEELAAAGHWQQVAYRKLTEQPEWLDAVLAEVPEGLHGAVRGNFVAGARLLDMHTPSPNRPVRVLDLPSWRIVAPPPADELRGYYEEAAAASGVDWTYLAAINLVETRMGRISGVSSAGAQGPMQFMPATWAEWGQGSVTDHRDAILAAGRYLQWGGMPGDVNGALFRYNRDTRYVDAVRTYAEQMQGDPRAYYGYYHWQVYYDTRADNVWLPHGWDNVGA